MLIKEKLSRITCGFCFLFCLLLSPDGWSSAPAPDERDEGGLILRRTPLEDELPVLSKDAFENLRVRIGGTTLSSSLFQEKATGQVWIGKSQGLMRTVRGGTLELDQEGNESLACREKIASDIYGLYGVSVPRTVLSRQQMTNTAVDEVEGQEAIHIMSCKIDDYHDYKKQFRFSEFTESLDPESGPVVCHDSRCPIEVCQGERIGRFVAYDVEGLGRAAAVATWVHDIDFIGGSAASIGYRIINRGSQSFAELIMVDPGESFSDPSVHPYPPTRHIRFAMPGSTETNTIAFERFFPEGSPARDEFLMTLHAIINTDEKAIVRFFMRPGAEFFVSRDPRSIPGLRLQLMERQKKLAIDYAPELEASRAKYETEEIEITRTIINARPPAPARPLPPAIPDIARGYEEIYLRFVRGSLIYKPNKDNDVGRIDLPFAAVLPNPLEGSFDLRGCGDTGKYLSINSGYRKGKRAENANKVEVWITPKFMVEQGLTSTARHLVPIMDSFPSPVGVFWTWGGWDNMGWYDSLTTQNFDDISDGKNLYEKYDLCTARRTWDGVGFFRELGADHLYKHVLGGVAGCGVPKTAGMVSSSILIKM